MSRILLFAAIVALAVMTGRATDPQPTPTTAAHTTVASPAPAPTPYTCTSASSCAVLAAALNGPTAQPQAPAPRHRQPRAQRTQRRTQAQHEDQPGWSCATQGNHVCGDGVAGGPLADDTCPAGGTRVYGTPHGCRYR